MTTTQQDAEISRQVLEDLTDELAPAIAKKVLDMKVEDLGDVESVVYDVIKDMKIDWGFMVDAIENALEPDDVFGEKALQEWAERNNG